MWNEDMFDEYQMDKILYPDVFDEEESEEEEPREDFGYFGEMGLWD